MPGRARQELDFVFLMDATSSMEKHLNVARNTILDFFKKITTGDNCFWGKAWRAKVVGFRDYVKNGPENWLIDHPFTQDISELERQFSSIRGNGGDGSPGSLFDALFRIALMDQTDLRQEPDPLRWRHKSEAAHIVILLTEVPHNFSLSSLPVFAGMDDKEILYNTLNVLEWKRIILYFVAPKADCFLILAETPRSEYNVIEGNDDLEATISDPDFLDRIIQQFYRTPPDPVFPFESDDPSELL